MAWLYPEGSTGRTIIQRRLAVGLGYFRVIKSSSCIELVIPKFLWFGWEAFDQPEIYIAPADGEVVSDRKNNYLDVYHHRVDLVTAFILAGGKSSRMGQDKAFLRLGRQTLLVRALELARTVTADGNPRIVGSAAKFAGFGPVVEDVYPECGPLAGIHAALSATGTDLNLMIAVDLPFLQPSFLNYLVSRGRETGATVVVPRGGGGLQPLCAVYRRGFLAVAESSLRAGKSKIDALFAEVQTKVVEREELKQNGFSEEMFRNLNTQQDWEDAKMREVATRLPAKFS